jgi:ABC-type uncharacterized transport system auxiliary subunit
MYTKVIIAAPAAVKAVNSGSIFVIFNNYDVKIVKHTNWYVLFKYYFSVLK